MALLKESNETLDSDGLLYHITAGYQLPFIQGFSLHAGYFSKTYTFQYKNRKALDEGWITWQSKDPGEALIENAEYTRHSLDASLNYKIHIKKIKSTLEFTAGYMWQENDERIEGSQKPKTPWTRTKLVITICIIIHFLPMYILTLKAFWN